MSTTEQRIRAIETATGWAQPMFVEDRPSLAQEAEIVECTRTGRRLIVFYEPGMSVWLAGARRSPDGLADARAFLEAEAAKLPAPSLTDRPRVALGR